MKEKERTYRHIDERVKDRVIRGVDRRLFVPMIIEWLGKNGDLYRKAVGDCSVTSDDVLVDSAKVAGRSLKEEDKFLAGDEFWKRALDSDLWDKGIAGNFVRWMGRLKVSEDRLAGILETGVSESGMADEEASVVLHLMRAQVAYRLLRLEYRDVYFLEKLQERGLLKDYCRLEWLVGRREEVSDGEMLIRVKDHLERKRAGSGAGRLRGVLDKMLGDSYLVAGEYPGLFLESVRKESR